MFWSKLGLIGFTVLWLAASIARAQADLPLDPIAPNQAKPTETGLFLEIPSVYGAAKYDQKVNEAPAAVTIITAEQIRKYGYRTFAQILDSAPGLFTNNDRNYGYLGIRGFNRPGDYTSRVLLLIDNHRLNDAVLDQGGSGTEMPIDVDLIDRIEIIKGPGSSLYGPHALFGVVNVIMKRGRDINGARVSGEASSFNTYRSHLSYGNKFSNGVEMLVSGSFSDSEDHRELSYPAFAATNNGIAKDTDRDDLAYYTSKRSYADFTLTGGHQWRKKIVPTAAFGTVFDDNRQHALDEWTYLDLVYQHEFAHQLTAGPAPITPHTHGTRVLLVEDNPVNRDVAAGLLELLGYHVDSVEDGRQACERSATQSYGVILMDCQMPVMDGFAATAYIRERDQQRHMPRTPIVALTANAMEGDRDRCLAAGMDGYLTKPFSHQALSDMLVRWCPPQDQRPPNAQTEVGERDKSASSPVPAQIDRDVWNAIGAIQKPGQPSVLHKIIGLYLTSSQAQVTQLRQAWQGRDADAMRGAAHSLNLERHPRCASAGCPRQTIGGGLPDSSR